MIERTTRVFNCLLLQFRKPHRAQYQVAVNNALLMQVRNANQNLAHVVLDRGECEELLRLAQTGEIIVHHVKDEVQRALPPRQARV